MLELRHQFPLNDLLKSVQLPRSTFYYQQQVATRPDKHAALKQCIRKVFARHSGRYGYRRVTEAVRKLGKPINHKTIQNLMVKMNLKSVVRPKKYKSYKGEVSLTATNVLARQFDASTMNQKWVTDVTEFNVGGEKLYLSPVMDLCNGEIIAYQMAPKPTFDLVTNMLRKALKTLRPDDRLTLYSDQGWHYRMPLYRQLLEQHGVVQSMSRKGNCYDNSPMESFFAVLKTEYFRLKKFASIEQLRAGLVRYIKYYNVDRIKTRLGGMSPVEYRTQLHAT
ncbi:Transposase InsO and inactivated derivatives [Massilia sp. CF038]|nr:Transposase InsO and inactivated derivatives [Massilia sp. CF038]